ncbi:MAG: hypothetical protein ACE5RC_07305 [Nitrosopumilus sp.]
MGLFSKKPSFCSVCNKELTHKHKPKREWNIKGPLCGDCHFEKQKEYYEGKVRQPCVVCGTTQKITDLWEPRWQWDMEGLLCKKCFDTKEEDHGKKKNFCSLCQGKMGLIRYNPKGSWKIEGQLCRKCWDEKKAEFG